MLLGTALHLAVGREILVKITVCDRREHEEWILINAFRHCGACVNAFPVIFGCR